MSILGERYTHGHVFDFFCALKRDPTRLRVLGDGRQEKSYLYVQDCVSAILTAVAHHQGSPGAHVYNLGTEETLVVDESVGDHHRVSRPLPEIEHTGGRRGWSGDSLLIHLDCAKMRSLGWVLQLTIRESIIRTLGWLQSHEYVWRARIGGAARHERDLQPGPLRISLGGGGTDLPLLLRRARRIPGVRRSTSMSTC